MKNATDMLLALSLSMAFAATVPAASATVVDIDIAGTNSWDGEGSANNEVLVIDLAAELGLASGSSITISGIGWDVSIEAIGASWLSETAVSFNGEFVVSPGVGDDAPGAAAFTSGGILSLADNGLPDIVLADGLLNLEFFESYDDYLDEIDAIWIAGSLSVETAAVPLPAALPLLLVSLCGMFIGGRRHRAS